MLTTVGLNDRPRFAADDIGDVRSDRPLPNELESATRLSFKRDQRRRSASGGDGTGSARRRQIA